MSDQRPHGNPDPRPTGPQSHGTTPGALRGPGRPTAPARDLALYERLISQGIAEADAHGSAIDHVTARRMALWLLPRSQAEPEFMRGLIRFAKTGAITHDLKARLRRHAWSPSDPHRPHAARLLQYAIARGADLGPISDDFSAVCDQIDRADAMVETLRDRAINSHLHRPPRPPRPAPDPVAMARHDDASQTVVLVLDAVTAKAAIHAITINAMEREAQTRDLEQTSRTFPEGSYGRLNRQEIIARETRITTGLRAAERAYRTALERDATPAPELTHPRPARQPDHDLELG
jgi:hypothetical protein